jgi:hypothetical protein
MTSSEQLSEMTVAEIERSLRHLVTRQDGAALPVLLRLARSVGTAIGSAGGQLAWTDRQDIAPAPAGGLTLYGIDESLPGPSWKALFEATWPGYRAWYVSEGDAVRPSLAVARSQLERYMPELVPT